jgi:chitinase
MKIISSPLAILILFGLIGLAACTNNGDIKPTNTSSGGGVINTPPSTVVMVNGYVPDWKSNSFYSSVNYSNLTIAYFAFIVCDVKGNIITNGNENKMTTMITAAHAVNTKAYLSFGGGGYYGSQIFFEMAKNDSSRKEFAHQVKDFCLAKGFDGFDVDWEGLSTSQEGLAHESLMKTLKDTLHEAGLGLIVTVQQGGVASFFTLNGIDQADLVQIMSYDQTGTWSGSPMGQHSSYTFAADGISYWNNKGIPKSKLVVGVPFYGYRFASMPCPCSAVTYNSISSAYPELADDVDYLTTGLYNKTYFNGYQTIMDKTSLANDQGTAGIMIWELSQDATGSKSLLTRMANELTTNGYTIKKLTNAIP